MLKPFIPQLQTTFMKALNDPARSVRLKAAAAMAQLMVIHMRVDPVFNDLNNNLKTYADDTPVRSALVSLTLPLDRVLIRTRSHGWGGGD